MTILFFVSLLLLFWTFYRFMYVITWMFVSFCTGGLAWSVFAMANSQLVTIRCFITFLAMFTLTGTAIGILTSGKSGSR